MEEQNQDDWVIMELMGHRRLVGKLTEATFAGGAFLRLDIPKNGEDFSTQYYSPAAVYCITPTTEDMVRLMAKNSQPAPVSRWELPLGRDENLAGIDDEI